MQSLHTSGKPIGLRRMLRLIRQAEGGRGMLGRAPLKGSPFHSSSIDPLKSSPSAFLIAYLEHGPRVGR